MFDVSTIKYPVIQASLKHRVVSIIETKLQNKRQKPNGWKFPAINPTRSVPQLHRAVKHGQHHGPCPRYM